MLFDEEDLKKRLDQVIKSFNIELKGMRTGRASMSTFENIQVDTEAKYGSKMSLPSIAKIDIKNAINAVIEVWDANIAAEVEAALRSADIGASITTGSAKNIFILNFNPLTQEDREEKVKELGQILESKKVNARHIRQEFMDDIKKLEKVPEDEQKRSEKQVQDLIDKAIDELDKIAKQKQVEIMSI